VRIKDMLGSLQARKKKSEKVQLYTVWGEQVLKDREDPAYVPLAEYPRPQFVREQVQILNGWWQCRFGTEADWKNPEQICREEAEIPILVPFSPECALSGVKKEDLPEGEPRVMLYARRFETQKRDGKRTILHFGAVDQECVVWIGGKEAGRHTGGYLPFEMDITDLISDGENEIRVLVRDETDRGWHARGKQKLKHGGMWYTPQSGIWQTVWTEEVPETWIREYELIPDPDAETLTVRLWTGAEDADVIPAGGEIWETEKKRIGEDGWEIRAKIPNPRLWSPEDPYLYEFDVIAGQDRARCYAAMRVYTKEKDMAGHLRFCLNHKPVFLNGALDQGYWPDGLLTPPADAAMEFDIREMKKCGINILRKHCKMEPAAWYAHCDRIGMMVWQDIVNGGESYSALWVTYLPTLVKAQQKCRREMRKLCGRQSKEGREEWLKEAFETVRVTRNDGCVACRTIFNEGWGQFETERVTRELTAADQSRMWDAASGWFDFGGGDFLSVHNYFSELEVPADDSGRMPVISEYGGVGLAISGHVYDPENAYQYRAATDVKDYQARFRAFQERLKKLEAEGLCGAVFTQVSDVEEETNGILTWDRKVNKLME